MSELPCERGCQGARNFGLRVPEETWDLVFWKKFEFSDSGKPDLSRREVTSMPNTITGVPHLQENAPP
jgi:hypothetical protein